MLTEDAVSAYICATFVNERIQRGVGDGAAGGRDEASESGSATTEAVMAVVAERACVRLA